MCKRGRDVQSKSEKGITEAHRIQRGDTPEWEQARKSEKCNCISFSFHYRFYPPPPQKSNRQQRKCFSDLSLRSLLYHIQTSTQSKTLLLDFQSIFLLKYNHSVTSLLLHGLYLSDPVYRGSRLLTMVK